MGVGRQSHKPNDITRAKVEVFTKIDWTSRANSKGVKYFC